MAPEQHAREVYERRERSAANLVATLVACLKVGMSEQVERHARLLQNAVVFAAGEERDARLEAAALECELMLFRPRRCDLPPAPPIPGHVYVQSSKPWACVAVEVVKRVTHKDWNALGLTQEHAAPEKVTVCGGKNHFPVTERFESGGWPRLKEVCPDCIERLLDMGLWPKPEAAADTC